jgi:hypothetical protein
MEKQILVLKGVNIESKEEALKKDGSVYYKFKINGKTYSCFDKDMGAVIHTGDNVNISYTQTQSGEFTYKNITSIVNADSVDVEYVDMSGQEVKNSPIKNETIKPLKTNNSDSDLFNVCVSESLNVVGRVYDTHYVKNAEEPVRFDEGWINAFSDMVKEVYDKALEVRKEKLGY